MAYRFNSDQFVGGITGRGLSYYNRANPESNLPDQDAFQAGNKALGYGAMVGLGAYPVVKNNLDMAPAYVNYMTGLSNASQAIGKYGNFRNAMQVLNPNTGRTAFDYITSPGNVASTALQVGLTSLNPFVGVGMLANQLTANDKNPFGTLPVFNEVTQGLDNLTNRFNESSFGKAVGTGSNFVYDNSIGLAMNNPVGRGLYGLAEIPVSAVGSGFNLLSEGYQALDRTLFGNKLPGGANPENPESMEFNDPFDSLKRALESAPGKFRTKTQMAYDELDSPAQQLVDRFTDKGIDLSDAIDLSSNFVDDQGNTMPADYRAILSGTQDLGYTPEQVKKLGEELATDFMANPFIYSEDDQMQGKFASNIELDDNYFVDLQKSGMSPQQRATAQMAIEQEHGQEGVDNLLGPNALPDRVLEVLNSDFDPDMSLTDATAFADMSEYSTKYGFLDIGEKDKFDIASQHNFDTDKYIDHIQGLEDFDVNQMIDRWNELSEKKRLPSLWPDTLSKASDREKVRKLGYFFKAEWEEYQALRPKIEKIIEVQEQEGINEEIADGDSGTMRDPTVKPGLNNDAGLRTSMNMAREQFNRIAMPTAPVSTGTPSMSFGPLERVR